jgi:hypothetical protein
VHRRATAAATGSGLPNSATAADETRQRHKETLDTRHNHPYSVVQLNSVPTFNQKSGNFHESPRDFELNPAGFFFRVLLDPQTHQEGWKTETRTRQDGKNRNT